MEERSDRRLTSTHAAIIAHQNKERILLVKIVGYDHWRLPYGSYVEGEHAIETARRVLQEQVCCDKVRYAQDLEETASIGFSSEDKATWDISATANFYLERDLHLYVAELSCNPSEMAKGRRVDSFNLVKPARLNEFLIGYELRVVEDICIDIVAGRL